MADKIDLGFRYHGIFKTQPNTVALQIQQLLNDTQYFDFIGTRYAELAQPTKRHPFFKRRKSR